MSLLSSVATGMFRVARDGRTVFGLPLLPGLPKIWYAVPDADTPEVESRFTRFYMLTFAAMMPATAMFFTDRLLPVIAVAVVWSHLGMRYWVLRGLERTTLTTADLEPIDRPSRDLAQAREIGEPTLWVLLVGAVLMAILDVVVLVSDGDWWTWPALAMFGTGAVFIARQIIALRRAES